MAMGRDEGEDLRHDSRQDKGSGEGDEEEEEEREEEDVILMDEVLGIPGIDTRINPHPPQPPVYLRSTTLSTKKKKPRKTWKPQRGLVQ